MPLKIHLKIKKKIYIYIRVCKQSRYTQAATQLLSWHQPPILTVKSWATMQFLAARSLWTNFLAFRYAMPSAISAAIWIISFRVGGGRPGLFCRIHSVITQNGEFLNTFFFFFYSPAFMTPITAQRSGVYLLTGLFPAIFPTCHLFICTQAMTNSF